MTHVVLGLGSNRSYNNLKPVELLSKACTLLSAFLNEFEPSCVYKSQAMYLKDQDDFYNMAVSALYSGTPSELLEQIHKVEAALGRDRSKEVRNGPRSLDVDIELFGRDKVNLPDLIIPHEKLEERAFVLKPLLDIFPKYAEEKDIAEFYSKKLSLLGNQRIEKFMEKKEFLALRTGYCNGTE